MKSIVLKLCVAAVLASSLSGCIIYVSPDKHDHFYIHHTKDGPASDEKPAPTTEKTPA
ncbi:hypothetical protein [Asticcacaulis solisilvae]|uniref:hypothetical protein n=1 Tax=Asticcacaulis solisilvae TaxID=1217274 RepID=UPI003FD8048C